MAKLPKSSRPDRRKPSDTEPHARQRDIFAPPLASSLSDVGTVAKILVGLFVPLVYAYLNSAHHLSDDGSLKGTYYQLAYVLTGIGFVFAAIEFARHQGILDTEGWGHATRRILIALNFVNTAVLFGGIGHLVWMQSHAYQERVIAQEAKARSDAAKRRTQEEALAECNAVKTREVEALVKRRQAAYAAYNKCKDDRVSPGLLSKETADQACQGKQKEFQGLAQAVKTREAKECTPAVK